MYEEKLNEKAFILVPTIIIGADVTSHYPILCHAGGHRKNGKKNLHNHAVSRGDIEKLSRS